MRGQCTLPFHLDLTGALGMYTDTTTIMQCKTHAPVSGQVVAGLGQILASCKPNKYAVSNCSNNQWGTVQDYLWGTVQD